MLPSAYPQRGGAYTRALKSEVTIPAIPVGGGAVDTNDWCIIHMQQSHGFSRQGPCKAW